MNQKTPSDSFYPRVNCGLSWITVSYIITMVDKMSHLVFRRMAHLKSQENPFGSLLAHRRGTFGMSRCQFWHVDGSLLACRRFGFGYALALFSTFSYSKFLILRLNIFYECPDLMLRSYNIFSSKCVHSWRYSKATFVYFVKFLMLRPYIFLSTFSHTLLEATL